MYKTSDTYKCSHRSSSLFHVNKWHHRLMFFILLFLFLFVPAVLYSDPVSAGNSFKLKRRNTQGSTITKDFFFFTDWVEGDVVDIYKCNRQGTNFSDCKIIVSSTKQFGHANAMQHEWGSEYFWVFDNGNPNAHGGKWCLNFSGDVVENSKCGKTPPNNETNSDVPGCRQKQGYFEFKDYFIKGGSGEQSGPNKIFVRKNEKLIKTIDAKFNSHELEDVSVDGDTGEIYYTTANIGSGTGHSTMYLHKVSDYKLPVTAGGSSSSSSSSGSVGQDSSRVKPAKPKTQDDVKISKSKYDGTIETTFFGTIKENGEGCGIFTTLTFVVDILTFGIGIAALIGIVVSGITIVTSKGNPERVAKAKRRLFEIVLGLALYAVMYAVLGFLLPGGKFNGQECSAARTDETHYSIS